MRRTLLTVLAGVLLLACGDSEPEAPAPHDATPTQATGAPAAVPASAPVAEEPLAGPAFDPLLACPSLASTPSALAVDGAGVVGPRVDDEHAVRLEASGRAAFVTKSPPLLGPTPAASPHEGDALLTLRFGASSPGGVTLLTGARSRGDALGVRLGATGPEIVRRGAAVDTVLASADAWAARAPRAGEWMLRASVRGDGQTITVEAKAWPAAEAEPASWAVKWSGPTGVTSGAVGPAGLALDGGAGPVALAYLLAGRATPEGIDGKSISELVSCGYSFPHAPPPRDGEADPQGDQANQSEAKALLHWAMRADVPRLVAVSAGTGNNLDPDDAVVSCSGAPWMEAARAATGAAGPARCITGLYEALEIAYATLRAAGYSDADMRDPSRVQTTLWGFGDVARGQTLWYHPAGADDDLAIPVYDLGGASAALHGPDGAPPIGFVPLASTFAYTDGHARDDGRAFRDALVALAASGTFPRASGGPDVALASDHVLVVSHSWGAAYTTSMLLREYPSAMPGLHVDLGITAALPKITADLDELAPCAAHLLTGDVVACMGGSSTVAPQLDVPAGFHVGPGGAPLYRIDRPDDPIATAPDVGALFRAAQDMLAFGMSGHDYVIREARSAATAQCTRSYQKCLVGGILCHEETETVRYPSDDAASYVGVYGVDTFHVSCTPNGHVLEFRCDDVERVAGTVCKRPPLGGMRVCASKPADCP